MLTDVAKLVDALDLGPSNFCFESSSLSIRNLIILILNFISSIMIYKILKQSMLPFTFQQLRILKAVATEKSFTKAAELLYLSQPSLSKQIKTLEKNLDILLIKSRK